MRAKIVAAALLAAALAVPTATAVAADSYGGGAHAWAPAAGDTGRISVKDNSSDGDPVKAEYFRTASADTKRTLWNHSGPGTTATSGDGSKIYKFKACDENYGDPDDCASNWTIR